MLGSSLLLLLFHVATRRIMNILFSEEIVLCKSACFCLLSTFYETPLFKNPSKNLCPWGAFPLKKDSWNPSKKRVVAWPLGVANNDRRAKKPIKQLWGWSRERVGVNFVYVLSLYFVYVLSFSWGKRKHINKIPKKCREIAGTDPEQTLDTGTISWNYVYVLSCLLGFFGSSLTQTRC